MIPKVIHYCWFGGGPLPNKDKKCIESWKKYCPDYEIKEWNESNYDISRNPYMAAAYKEKKWGFVSDYARLDIVYSEGGFYLDTDVELVKPLDEVRDNSAFMGFEGGIWTSSGLGFGAEVSNNIIRELREIYKEKSFYNSDGSLNLTPCPYYATELLVSKGLKQNNEMQVIDGMRIYPTEFFGAKDYETGKINRTERTVSIHHYNASWQTPTQKIKKRLKLFIGDKKFKQIANLVHFFSRTQ